MKRWVEWAAAGLIVACLGQAGRAEIMRFSSVPREFSSFGVVGPACDLLVTEYNHRNLFTGTFASQAFELADGNYLYLYQADNYGPSVLELIWISPFHRPELNGGMGYLTGDVPTGFLPVGLPPPGRSYFPDLHKLSYQYPSGFGMEVPAGEHTSVIYAKSPCPPAIGVGQVINADTVAVDVAVAIPEPLSLALLAGGGVGILLPRRRLG
jgi:hypothetical protein